MNVRIDKFCWCVRLTKTRSQATDEIKRGKIKLNGESVKASRDVKLGETIMVSRHGAVFTFRIIQFLDKRVGAKLVVDYLRDETAPDELEKYKVYLEAQRTYRDYGTGKPTKKDRRDLNDFWDGWD